jgi:hypothetical protein
MTNFGMTIKHPKRRGEWVEMCFMVKAIEHELRAVHTWGEMDHYDFVVEYEADFKRVQVKSTMFKDRGGYSCTVRGSAGPYEDNAFDFLAAYVIPEDTWYIIPAEQIRGQGSIALYPQLKKSKYGKYREAWQLLREHRVAMIEACEDGGLEDWSGEGQVAVC